MANSQNANRATSESDINDVEEEFKSMDIDSKRVVNILLFGETGVGKSTFINAFANYLSYSSLRFAMRNKLEVIIPTKFSVMDENYEERIIEIGEDNNECTDVGASATQYCRSYIFPIKQGKLKIRLIDTPGIADTRGVNTDNSNFENILTFISELKHLNAICFLLKPNVSRLTVQFEYCIKQLLSRLDKSASNNLVFVFTNTRSTFYRPGETLPALKKLFEGIHSVKIPLSKKNMFCMDNESLRFLAAYKNKIKFDRQDIDDFSESWKSSSREFWRMIHYIAGGGPNKNAPLEPHMVKNIISINEARRLILQLSQPLAEITQLIQDNISALQKHTTSINTNTSNIDQLKQKLFIPFINLVLTKLYQPTTVCTAVGCSELYQVNDKKKWHYKQKCHNPCYLSNVPNEIVGSPELMRCAAMGSGNSCIKCGCSYKVHMHYYYETRTVEDQLEDKDVQKQIESKQVMNITVSNHIRTIKRRMGEYEQERVFILKTTAKFAYFLQENAITPYNDAYQSYLNYLIDRENSMGRLADVRLILEYRKMLEQYEEEKRILNQAITDQNAGSESITANEIINSIKALYSLKHNGQKIKEMITTHNATRKKELKSEFNEYVHSVRTRNTARKPSGRRNNITSDSEYATDQDRRSKSKPRHCNQNFNNYQPPNNNKPPPNNNKPPPNSNKQHYNPRNFQQLPTTNFPSSRTIYNTNNFPNSNDSNPRNNPINFHQHPNNLPQTNIYPNNFSNPINFHQQPNNLPQSNVYPNHNNYPNANIQNPGQFSFPTVPIDPNTRRGKYIVKTQQEVRFAQSDNESSFSQGKPLHVPHRPNANFPNYVPHQTSGKVFNPNRTNGFEKSKNFHQNVLNVNNSKAQNRNHNKGKNNNSGWKSGAKNRSSNNKNQRRRSGNYHDLDDNSSDESTF